MATNLRERLSFKLRPMTEEDVPTCAQIAHQASLSDCQTQFKASNPTNPYNHEEGTKYRLRNILSQPKGPIDLIVAEDDGTGEILGLVGWGYRGFDPVACEQEIRKAQKSSIPTSSQPPRPPTKPDLSDPKTANLSDRDRLERYTSADMAAWMAYLMPPGTKCMYIESIVVSPARQGQGVGGALLKYGTTIADSERAFGWVHASEAGAEAFVKAGFEEVGRLVLDLDEWNLQRAVPPLSSKSASTLTSGDGSSNGDQDRVEVSNSGKSEFWGGYGFKYMRRQLVDLGSQWVSYEELTCALSQRFESWWQEVSAS